jgi:hypothetical protein
MQTLPQIPPGFFACSSGELIRATGPATVVRANYRTTHAQIASGADLRATLRNGPYAWPGGYPLYFVTNDGEVLSFAAVLERIEEETRLIRSGERSRIVACDVNYEDAALYCSHSNERIPSAYAEDDAAR